MPPAELTRFGPAQIQQPARAVKHVYAHVADNTVAVFHEPPPPAPVREPFIGSQRRRAGPHFVVQKIGHGLDRPVVPANASGNSSTFPPGRFCRAIRRPRPASSPRSKCGVLRRWVPTCTTRPSLRAARQHGLAFEHIRTDGLLAIHIGARFHGGDGRQRVPMIRRADQHEVEILFLEHFAEVSVAARLAGRTSGAGRPFPPRPPADVYPDRKSKPLPQAPLGAAATNRSCHTSPRR